MKGTAAQGAAAFPMNINAPVGRLKQAAAERRCPIIPLFQQAPGTRPEKRMGCRGHSPLHNYILSIIQYPCFRPLARPRSSSLAEDDSTGEVAAKSYPTFTSSGGASRMRIRQTT